MSEIAFSLRLNNDLSVRDFTELAVRAEAAGFSQVWVSHDLFLRAAPVLVASAAVATSRIGLGIGVMNPYSVHPAELAMAAATLQELSGGRFLLGIGAGAEEFLSWAGITREAPLERTRQAVLALKTLLGGGRPAATPQSGSSWRPEAHLRFDAVPVPVYLGAMGPRMLDLAGEIADGVLALSFPPEDAPDAARRVAEAARAAGRDPESIDVPACFWCSVDDDLAAAEGALKDKLAYYGTSISPVALARSGLSPEDFRPAAEALEARGADAARLLVTTEMLSLGIAGDPERVIGRSRRLVAAGARHLSFGPPLGPDPLVAVDRLGAEVLPALRPPDGPPRSAGAVP